jgi:hypothetical protein
MSRLRSPFSWFILALLATAGLTAVGPPEQSLGANIRIVYLHGAWAIAAEVAFGLAALAGLVGIVLRRQALQRWSTSLGYTGLFFWLTYLPLSLWAMQANWNGLFLAEPRFHLAVVFAITGVLLQAGLLLLGRPLFTSLFNVLFFAALRIGLFRAAYVMHPPPSPIFNSGNLFLEVYFLGVILLALAAAWFLARSLLLKLK